MSLGQLAAGFNALGDDEPALEIWDAWGLGIAKAVSLIAFWTLAWLPGFTLPICVIDAVLFVLYYRAIAFNARQVILANRRVAEPAVA